MYDLKNNNIHLTITNNRKIKGKAIVVKETVLVKTGGRSLQISPKPLLWACPKYNIYIGVGIQYQINIYFN
jgi:predicted RNase H-related nuclease YkuK (DUF458 family)